MPFVTACSLNVSGCNITILVDDAGGRDRHHDVAAVLGARVADVAGLVVAGLRAAAPPDDWSLVDDVATVAIPADDDRAWPQRLADAEEHGAAVAAALAAGRPVPKAAPLPPPLRSRVWAAVGGVPEMAGLYARWQPGDRQRGAAEAAAHAPPSTVRGYLSLAEALAFARGAGAVLPDRRYA
jgi:hypothetical protein